MQDRKYEKPIGIKPYPEDEKFCVVPGERCNLVMIVQIMLDELKMYYDDFGAVAPCGVYDGATEEAVRAFQRKCGIADDGVVDSVTWNRMAEEFNASVYADH